MDLEIDTDLVRVVAQNIGDVADTLAASLPPPGYGDGARGQSAGSACVREAMRTLGVAEARSRAATAAVTSHVAEISAALTKAARAFDAAEALYSGG